MINELFDRFDRYHKRIKEAYERGIRERYGDDYDDECEDEWDDEKEEDLSISDNDEKHISGEVTNIDKYPPYSYRTYILPDYRGYYLPTSPDTDLDEIRFDQSWDCILGHGDYKHAEHRVKPCRYSVSPDNPWYFEIDGVVFSKETGLLILFPPGKSEAYTIPDDERITGIGDGAFAGNMLLKEIILNDRIRYIGYSAFARCLNLQEIEIPQSVEYMNQAAFADCPSLKRVNMRCRIRTIPYRCFQNDTSLETVRLPEGIEFIDRGAFSGCCALNDLRVHSEDRNDYDIILPSTLREVKGETFCGCTSIRSVLLQKNIITIGDCAFAGCTALQTVSSESVENYRAYCFRNCTSLENFSFSTNTRKLGRELFGGANNLEKITFACAPDLICDVDALPNDAEYQIDAEAYLATARPYNNKMLFFICIQEIVKSGQISENAARTAQQTLKRNRKKHYQWILQEKQVLEWALDHGILDCFDCIAMLQMSKIDDPKSADIIRKHMIQKYSEKEIAVARKKWEEQEREKKRRAEENECLKKELLKCFPEDQDIKIKWLRDVSTDTKFNLARFGISCLNELASISAEELKRGKCLSPKVIEEIRNNVNTLLRDGLPNDSLQDEYALEDFSVDDLLDLKLDDDDI